MEEKLGKEGVSYRNTPTDKITTDNSKNNQEPLLNMKEVSGCRLITFCSCFQVMSTYCEVFKHVTMDDSSTGLRLIISDLTDILCDTDRVISRVFLLKIRDGNSFNGLSVNSLSRNKHQKLKINENYVILISLDSQTSMKLVLIVSSGLRCCCTI